MAKAPAYKWEFRARFRRHAFGWKSQRAIKRIKEAVSEIKRVQIGSCSRRLLYDREGRGGLGLQT